MAQRQMNILSLVWSEIIHRKPNFVIALSAITLAVATCVAIATMWDLHRAHTDAKVAELSNEIRKITKDMGFNITILPKEVNLTDFHASDFADETMPEDLVHRLANSPDIITVNHLRPALIRKVDWPEQNRELLLMGVSGVVPFAHRDPKKPLSEPVPDGVIHVGHLLARDLGLTADAAIQLRGREFTVGKVYDKRGTKDDITAWIDLKAAQDMLELPGKVNMIQALECNCASLDRLGDIQNEIGALLGDQVQIIEHENIATARAKTRNQVKSAGAATLNRLSRLSARLLPLLTVAVGVIVGLLSLANVRERRQEIGVLRAVGLRSRQILTLFLSKAMILGLLGGLIGYFSGLAAGGLWGSTSGDQMRLFRFDLLAAAMAITPLLVMAACWVPAVVAAKQDPAEVLREE